MRSNVFAAIIVLVVVSGVVGYSALKKPETAPPVPSPTPRLLLSPSPNRGLILEAQKGTIENATRNLPPSPPLVISMVARQWVFEPATVQVNLGQPVTLRIASMDVKHGISIPDFGVSADLEPGKTTDVTFTPDKAGTFTFFCNVFCGAGHRDMRGTLIVE